MLSLRKQTCQIKLKKTLGFSQNIDNSAKSCFLKYVNLLYCKALK